MPPSMGTIGFGALAVPAFFSLYGWGRVFHALLRPASATKATLWLYRMLFRMLFGCIWWLDIRDAPTAAEWRAVEQGAAARGCLIMVNHTSQLDGFLFGALASPFVVCHTKSLMKSVLFKIPLAGKLFSMMGHLPVFFKSDAADASFSVDKERQAPINEIVNRHLSQDRGILSFCPEVRGHPFAEHQYPSIARRARAIVEHHVRRAGDFVARRAGCGKNVSGARGLERRRASAIARRKTRAVPERDVTPPVSARAQGKINREDPAKVADFRRGAFQQAIDLRLPIYGLSTYGNHWFWPNKAALGGRAATITCDLYAVEEWNATAAGDAPLTTTAAELSELCQARMQRSVDGTVARHPRHTNKTR